MLSAYAMIFLCPSIRINIASDLIASNSASKHNMKSNADIGDPSLTTLSILISLLMKPFIRKFAIVEE